MVRRPQRATRTVTLVPYTTCVRAYAQAGAGMSAAQTRHVPAPQWHDRADAAAWAETAATQIAQPLQRDLQTQPQALLLLSGGSRSEEHTSELQSLMRISYAGFCLKKKNTNQRNHINTTYL